MRTWSRTPAKDTCVNFDTIFRCFTSSVSSLRPDKKSSGAEVAGRRSSARTSHLGIQVQHVGGRSLAEEGARRKVWCDTGQLRARTVCAGCIFHSKPRNVAVTALITPLLCMRRNGTRHGLPDGVEHHSFDPPHTYTYRKVCPCLVVATGRWVLGTFAEALRHRSKSSPSGRFYVASMQKIM